MYELYSKLLKGDYLAIIIGVIKGTALLMAPSAFPVGLGERVRFDTKRVWVDYNNLGPNGCSDS